MWLQITEKELFEYVSRQTEHFFPDNIKFQGKDVEVAFTDALFRTEHCFQAICHPGYHDETGNVAFSHLHGDQYASFLYFFGNSLWNQSQNKPICDKLMQLNRVLNTLFISYKCRLPEHFFLGHAYGTILGNAVYSDYLVVFQGVTVNTAMDEAGNPAPHLGKGLFLGAHSKIIGNMPIGDRVSIGVNAVVYNQMISDDCVVIAQDSTVVRKRKKEKCAAQNYFSDVI